MDSFHSFQDLAGFSVRPAPKESCYHLPLRRIRRCGLHFAHMRRDPEAPSPKANDFCHCGSVSGYGFAFQGGGLGIRE